MSTVRDARFVEGEPEAHEKVFKFLTDQLASSETEGDVVVELEQAAKGTTKDGVGFDEWEFTPGDDLDKLVEKIIDSASNRTMQLRYLGKTRYQVRIAGRVKAQAFTLIAPATDEDTDDLDDFEEQPNKKGLLAQLMRHMEVKDKSMLRATQEGREERRRQYQELEIRCQNAERKNSEYGKIVEDLRNMQFARDMKREEVQDDRKMRAEIADGLFKRVLPVLAAHIAGGDPQAVLQMVMQGGPKGDPAAPLANGAPTNRQALLEAFFGSVGQEQFTQFTKILSQQQMACLGQIHSMTIERRDKAEAEEKRRAAQATQPTTNGVANGVNGAANGAHP